MPNVEAVTVVVRVRPLLNFEKRKQCAMTVSTDTELCQVTIHNPKTNLDKTFAYDQVYSPDSEQVTVYQEVAFPLVESVMAGYNGTIFAYGQTGCGKTFTMAGSASAPGIIPNAFAHVFTAIEDSSQDKQFLLHCSYCEIYNEEIRDLLSYDPAHKLELKENKERGVYVKDLSMRAVTSVSEIHSAMSLGNSHRVTKETAMNERSSRSHSIFTVYVESSQTLEGKACIRAGKLNLVDLAGSERQKKTGVTGDRLREAIEINLSLSSLGNVISALVDGASSHVPYRDSKLTRLLQDSLGGNTKTVMIAVISPADYNYEESLSTLRYASRAKFIKNKPRINEDPKDALLRQYAEEITRLKALLSEQGEETRAPSARHLLQSRSRAPPGVQLQETLKQLQGQVVQGGEVTDEAEAQRVKEHRKLRHKLKKERQQHKRLLEQHRHKEEELLLREGEFQSMQEESADLRKLLGRLQSKYKAAVAEIGDLSKEFEQEREELLDAVRSKDVELDFVTRILSHLIDSAELSKIRAKSSYDSDNHQWTIPSFVMHQKQTVFPKLPRAHLKDALQHERRKKKLVFKNYGVSPSPEIFNINEESDEERDHYPEITRCNLDGFGSLHGSGLEADSRPTTSGTRSRQHPRQLTDSQSRRKGISPYQPRCSIEYSARTSGL